MLQLLISRSGGSARKLSVSGLTSGQSILFIANHAQSLQTLQLPRSQINDSLMETISEKLSTLTSLDLSYCINIGAQALKTIGKNCKSLTTLRRVMHSHYRLGVILNDMHSQEDEALAIATSMPRLEHLEIAYLPITTSSVLEILKNCKHLELLDIRGCWNVDLEEKFVKGFGKLKVVGPSGMYCYEPTGWDNWSSDYSGSLSYLAWDEDDEDDAFWEEY